MPPKTRGGQSRPAPSSQRLPPNSPDGPIPPRRRSSRISRQRRQPLLDSEPQVLTDSDPDLSEASSSEESAPADEPSVPLAASRRKNPEPATVLLFTSPAAEEKFHLLETRRLLRSRQVNLPELRREGISLIAYLDRWSFMLRMNRTTFPRLVRLFYANLVVFRDSVTKDVRYIESSVLGTRIQLDYSDFARLLQIPINSSQIRLPDSPYWSKRIPDFDPAEAIQTLVHSAPISSSIPEASKLDVIPRLLHKVIAHCILPKSGSFDHITIHDFELLWCLFSKLDIDLAFIMLNRLANFDSKKSSPLPYGMYLSHIIVESVGAIRNETSVALRHSDVINKATLGRMNLVKENGRWITKDNRGSRLENAAVSPPLSLPAPLSQGESRLLESLQDLSRQMSSHFAQQTALLENLDSRLRRIEDRFDSGCP